MLVDVAPIGLRTPNVSTSNHSRVWITENLRLVEAVSGARIPRSRKTVSILQVLVIEVEYDDAVYVTDPEFPRNLNFDERLRFVLKKQYQRAGIGSAGEYGKIHAMRNDGGPKGKRAA